MPLLFPFLEVRDEIRSVDICRGFPRIMGVRIPFPANKVLLLDIEGAFPNVVPSKLLHNLKKRKVPNKLINFTAELLEGHITTLKFDDHISAPFLVDNGIGQATPC